MVQLNVRKVTRGHPDYPALLAEIFDPPPLLHVLGSAPGHGPCVAVVGSRRPTRYGLDVAERLGAELATLGVTIVSGMARGIDAAAHRGALAVGGRTVAVLGCGVDVCYPRSNRDLYHAIIESGCVVSELTQGTPPLPHHFPSRNRIIAGMSNAVVIVEGRPNGGAMITARLALEAGREVFAIPGAVHSPQSEGPHQLIREGARLVTSATDILEDLGLAILSSPDGGHIELTADESRLIAHIEAEPELIDRLAHLAHMPVSTTSAILSGLEMKGLVVRTAGARFALSAKAGPEGPTRRSSSSQNGGWAL